MTASEAAEYAPQWGSYMHAGDSGACMYGELTDKATARAASEHIESHCVPIALAGDCCGLDAPCRDDLDALQELRGYLESVQ
jgi:hypothetical protein